MKNITKEQIKQHIINVLDNEYEFSVDKHLTNDYKSKILNGRNDDAIDYIAKRIIGDIDRHSLNIEKRDFDINQVDLSDLVEYLISGNFPFKEYLQESIENKLYKSFMFSENIDEIFNMNGLISAIVTNLHILNLVKQNERLNLAKQGNMKKIENAINTLFCFTDDKQVKHYLESIKIQTRDITTSTILSCIFCNLYKILEEMLPDLNKSRIQEDAVIIMQNVFNSTKEYRYYTKIEKIDFKGYKLRKFKAN